MQKTLPSKPIAYFIAVGATVLGTLLGLAFGGGLGGDILLIFILAVLAASWYGGLGSGLLATALSLLAGSFLLEPMDSLQIGQPGDLLRLLLFTLIGVALSALNGFKQPSHRHPAHSPPEQQDTAALWKGHEWLGEIAESMGNVLWISDPAQRRLIYASHAFEQIWGQPLQELYEDLTTWLKAIHPDDRERVERAFFERVPEGSYDEQYRVIRPDGTVRWVRDRSVAVRNPPQDCQWVFGIAEDITERKQLAESLQHSGAILSAISENTPTLIYLKDRQGRMVMANPATVQAIGKPLAEIIGKTDVELFGMKAGKAIMANDQHILDSGQAEVFEEKPYLSAGRVILSTKTPYRDERGSIIGVIGIGTDISHRKRLEAALRESEQRLRAIFEQTAVGIAQCDLAGRFVQVNQHFCEIVGFSAQTLYGLRMQDITHPDDLPPNTIPLEQQLKSGRFPYTIEKRYVRPDGLPVWVNESVSLIRDEADQPLFAVDIIVNITDRKQSLEAVRHSEERLRLAVQATGIGIIETDFPSNRNLWTARSKAIFGIPPEAEITREALFARIHPDDRQAVQQAIDGSLDPGGDGFFHVEHRVCWPDGTIHWVLGRGRTAFDGDPPRPLRSYGVIMDITERKQAEEALREADRRKDEFLATLAHELRNPLAPIRNGLQILRLAGNDEALREQAYAMMERQLRQLVRLIDDLLDVSRITRGKIELRKEPIELAAVIDHAVEISRPLIEAAGHELTVKLPGEPLRLEADPLRLAQVFSNLLNNAAKFTPPRGQIEISAEHRGGGVLVSITDTGIGIPPEMLPHIFDLFTQVDKSLGRSHGGLGIGLSLVRGLVELHGGHVEAHSSGSGQGSAFSVRLPALPSSAAGPAASVPAPDQIPSSPVQRRILVVDDNEDAASSLATMLQIMGHETRTAYDGLQALALAEAFRPEVVLLDLGMPRLDGYQTARRLRTRPWGRQLVLVAVTGWGQEEDRRRTRNAGFNHHLVKPANPADLERLLAETAEADTKMHAL